MMNLVGDLPEDYAVFYFLVGEGEERDFLYAKGDLDMMSEALSNLMKQNPSLEHMVRNAIKEFQKGE
ncbi:MAG TPA: hypothetical protein ENH85_02260 [Candidatus Scalindua sp.]|nr:hypothetical protein [Candidatus Scalindua sp.]